MVIFCYNQKLSAQLIEEENIKNVISLFFEGIHEGDTLIIKQTIAADLKIQTIYTNEEDSTFLRTEKVSHFLNKIASKDPGATWDEKLLSYGINIDNSMANVWTPYEFYYNGIFSHCGVNSFQLYKENDQWKIIYLIDTRRKQNCNN
ncbi:MAG: nuclear transport factor 2 family protein [Bacteroidia bacterium]|nr:nuclear transport factor 2 family protein [Bacteroidia bacterium]